MIKTGNGLPHQNTWDTKLKVATALALAVSALVQTSLAFAAGGSAIQPSPEHGQNSVISEKIGSAKYSLEALDQSRAELQTNIIRLQTQGQNARAKLKQAQAQAQLTPSDIHSAELSYAEMEYALRARESRQSKQAFEDLNQEKLRVLAAIARLEANQLNEPKASAKPVSGQSRSPTNSVKSTPIASHSPSKVRIGKTFTLLYGRSDIKDEIARMNVVSGNRTSSEQQTMSIRFMNGNRILSSQNLRLQGRGNAQFSGELMFGGSLLELQSGRQIWKVPVDARNRSRPFILNMDARDPRDIRLTAYPKNG